MGDLNGQTEIDAHVDMCTEKDNLRRYLCTNVRYMHRNRYFLQIYRCEIEAKKYRELVYKIDEQRKKELGIFDLI